MNLQELFFILKFAYHLKKKGLLTPLVSEIVDFEDRYYYPLRLEKKAVMLESIFKSLTQKETDKDIDKLKEMAKEITEEFFTDIYGERKHTKEVLEDLRKEGKLFDIVREVLKQIKEEKKDV